MKIALAIMILFTFTLPPCEAQQKPEAKHTLEKMLDALYSPPPSNQGELLHRDMVHTICDYER
jgi:hypothetical protein